jgi:hypothetical protein
MLQPNASVSVMAGGRTPADGKRLGEQMSKKISGFLTVLAFLGLSLFLINCGSSSSRPAGVLYVLSQGESQVGSFAIDLTSGVLSLLNKTSTTCTTAPCGFPETILLDPTGANAFVLNQGVFSPGDPTQVPPTAPSGVVPSIYGYTVQSDGTLTMTGDLTSTPKPPTPVACDKAPQGVFTACDLAVAMTLDASGKFLFVVTQGNQGLQPPLSPLPPQLVVFGVQGTTLSTLSTTNLTRVPTSVAVITATTTLSDGSMFPKTLLYITNDVDLADVNDNTVAAYQVDATSGAVTPQSNPVYVTGSVPTAVVAVKTSPTGGSGGLFVYVTNSGSGSGSDSINVFKVCTELNANCSAQDVNASNNTLIPVGNPVSVGLDPVAMTLDPTNNFLYVVNHGSSTVSAFRINPTTGALSALNPSSVSTGSSPVAITMHSSGKFLYVSNNASSNVSGFNVDTTSGALSNATNVTSSAQPAGLVAK